MASHTRYTATSARNKQIVCREKIKLNRTRTHADTQEGGRERESSKRSKIEFLAIITLATSAADIQMARWLRHFESCCVRDEHAK